MSVKSYKAKEEETGLLTLEDRGCDEGYGAD